jgi:hypothetical protein
LAEQTTATFPPPTTCRRDTLTPPPPATTPHLTAQQAESYEAKEEYNHAPAPHAKKVAYGHRHSFESVCLQEVEGSCDVSQNDCLLFGADPSISPCKPILFSAELECCKALPKNGKRQTARMAAASGRTKQVAQLLELFGNTDSCHWGTSLGRSLGVVTNVWLPAECLACDADSPPCQTSLTCCPLPTRLYSATEFQLSIDEAGFSSDSVITQPDESGIDSPGVLPIGKAVGTCYFSDDLKCGPFCNAMTLNIEVR